jgi:hypothetical protein
MTMHTTDSPAITVTLPVHALQAIRVRELAMSTLHRIDLFLREVYWASEEGRADLNAMYCGEQDAIDAARQDLRAKADEHDATAHEIGLAIWGSGYQTISLECGSRFGTILKVVAECRELLNDEKAEDYAAYPECVKYLNDTYERLHQFCSRH